MHHLNLALWHQKLLKVCYLKKSHWGTVGFIADIFGKSSDILTLYTLILQTTQYLKTHGADAVATLTVPNTIIDKALNQAGFLFSWGAFDVRMVPLKSQLSLDALGKPHHWIMAGGDFDVI